ncbi:MAG: N-acetyltransferase [Hyphomicrobiales bacterium]|nr:N-acetyltransferase [Hyphomicrobiales bacterium]
MQDSQPVFSIQPERAGDEPDIVRLNARAFGPGRFARTAYRIREGLEPAPGLRFTARIDDRLVGSIRFTAVAIGGAVGGLLLGPLVIDPDYAGRGAGRALIDRGLGVGRDEGYRLVLLVGDLSYYERCGFQVVPPGRILLPGPVDPARLLAAELVPGALGDYAGLVRGSAARG